MAQQPKKLLDQVRDAIRLKHYAYSTEKTYVYWAKRYILFHNKRHPLEMGEKEISEFLTHLAVEENVAASTQNPCAEQSEVRPSARYCSYTARYCAKIWICPSNWCGPKGPSACPQF